MALPSNDITIVAAFLPLERSSGDGGVDNLRRAILFLNELRNTLALRIQVAPTMEASLDGIKNIANVSS